MREEYSGDNPILKYFAIARPRLWDENVEDFTRVAFILSHALKQQGGHAEWDNVTDALAELIPEQKDFWLRVQATWNTQFEEAMTAMFLEVSDE